MGIVDRQEDPQQPINAEAESRRILGRDQIERTILLDKGCFRGLEGTWKTCKDAHGKDVVDEGGKLVWTWGNKIWIPRWSLRQMMQCSDRIARIVATLFPDDLFFLFTVDMSELATAASRINEILFYQVAPEVVDICCFTCGVETDEEREQFINSITPRDILEIFTTVVEKEISNENMQAITKKVQRLLGERFSLENVFPNLGDIMEQGSMQFLTDLQQINSTSLASTAQSEPDEQK